MKIPIAIRPVLFQLLLVFGSVSNAADFGAIQVTRLGDGPIIQPQMDDRMGGNIQGPSLIKVPDWIENPLGKYYLYFADHRGTYIRMAYAEELQGPWGKWNLVCTHSFTGCAYPGGPATDSHVYPWP